MKGLSNEIKLALDVTIEGLEYKFDISQIDEDKMKKTMDSKVSSFISAKKLIKKWTESVNAPTETVLKKYVRQILKAGDGAIKTLREALSTKINFEELDSSKHDSAIKAKPIILEAIFELDDALRELREQLENDKLSFEERSFRLGFPERFAKKEFLDISQLWKNPLDENGAVIICPYGTKGVKIVLDNLEIWLPKPPINKEEILFHDLPKSEQYWRRPEPPNFSPENEDKYTDFIKEEFRRRVEGIWFFNNGKPVYLTGHMYFTLTYVMMMDNGGYMDFRYAQLNMFYHAEACIRDPRCLGQIFLKSRRTGFTQSIIGIQLNNATMNRNHKYGNISKTNTDGQEVFYKISFAFQALPFYFRPVVQGKIDSPSHLFFSAPADSSRAAKKANVGNVTDYLNTMIDFRACKNSSYDSIKLNGYLLDECFAPDTKILTPNGFKEINEIKIGDKVINHLGIEKTVVNRIEGTGNMYKVVLPYGKNYYVNENHKLYVNYGSDNKCSRDVFMSPKEYFEIPEHRRRYVRRKVSKQFKYSEKELPIPPYIFGLWLGDGFSTSVSFAVNLNLDPEIVDALKEYCNDVNLVPSYRQSSENCHVMRLNGIGTIGSNQTTGVTHPFKKKLIELGVWGNKRIPEIYMKASVKQRLELIAGIIDTDGYKYGSNSFNIGMSRKELTEEIRTVVKELGLDCNEIKHRISNFESDVYAFAFTDYNATIPCRVKRKKPKATKLVHRRSRMYIEPHGVGDFIGITVDAENDEDALLILEDYTISKNCGKWEKPNNVIDHLAIITPTLMPNSGRVVGTLFAGSTVGKHSEGGTEFIELIKASNVLERDPRTQKTATALYSYFLPAQDNIEDFTDKYGVCHTVKPEKKTFNVYGGEITKGSLEHLIAIEEQKKKQSDLAYAAYIRTMPRTMEHAMRDEATECVFNLNKLIDQIDYNISIPEHERFVVGNFDWIDEVDGDVAFFPNSMGRFKVAWLPSVADNTQHLANNVEKKGDKFYPLNRDCVRFGCDPYSIKGTHGSKGALHGKTIMFPEGGPSNQFVVEYIARPADEYVFFEDVIKAIRYYGAPILVELNRGDLLRHMFHRGYRPFAMDRLDKPTNKLSVHEAAYGGQTMSGVDIIDSHQNSVGNFIERYVGISTNDEIRPLGDMGIMPFNETLQDWCKYDPSNRTKHDATISSGLAIMACQTEKYKGTKKEPKKKIVNFVKKYDTSGSIGKLIN